MRVHKYILSYISTCSANSYPLPSPLARPLLSRSVTCPWLLPALFEAAGPSPTRPVRSFKACIRRSSRHSVVCWNIERVARARTGTDGTRSFFRICREGKCRRCRRGVDQAWRRYNEIKLTYTPTASSPGSFGGRSSLSSLSDRRSLLPPLLHHPFSPK